MVMRRPTPSRPATDGESTADDLVRLVLALVETLRQLIERQAIRRVEGGHLRDDDIERLGLALLRLEQRMDELKAHFGLQDEDLSLRLDLGDLLDTATRESESSAIEQRHDATAVRGKGPAVCRVAIIDAARQ
jgi:hypothetical protein